jgi:hypothetical protein
MFVVESVARFSAERPATLRTHAEPSEIPGGFMATYEDPAGNRIYVLDQSAEGAGTA